MTMAIYDDKDNFIKELPAGKSAGINIVNIPIYLPMPKSAPTKNRMALGGTLSPPTLPEGNYVVKITKGDKEYATPLTLSADPKSLYALEDRQLGHATQMKLYNMTEQLAYIYDGLTTLHTEVAKRNSEVKNKKWNATLNTFAKETEKLKASLVSLEGDFYIDESANLREDISTLALNISFFPGKPSASQLAKTEELNERLQDVQRQFDRFKSQLESINTYLQQSNLAPVNLITFEEFKKK
jgi:prefoldin subunit 5